MKNGPEEPKNYQMPAAVIRHWRQYFGLLRLPRSSQFHSHSRSA